jgi:1,4-alpha-glucan branching enzyme
MNKLFAILLFSLVVNLANAQLITCDPLFPSDQDEAVITFNAKLGNGGLEGYTGDVYAHTGVITNLSTSDSDWKYVKSAWGENLPSCKLLSVGEDLWSLTISPSIREYYGVPSSETIEKMAFVFRSGEKVDGNYLEGKTVTGGDIFYEVNPASLTVSITIPEETPAFVELNENLMVKWIANMADSSFLYVGDEKVFAGAGESFEYEFTITSPEKKWVKAVAIRDTEMAVDSFYYYVIPDPIIEAVPEGIENGINVVNDSTVILCLYAPMKDFVFVGGDFTNWELTEEGFMKFDDEAERFWVEITHLDPQTEYGFQYVVDGEILLTDPYCELVLDPWNDKYIPESTYPNLKPYPVGKTDGLVSVFQIQQEEYEWQNTSFDPPAVTDLVVYELLVRDFVQAQNYQTLTDTLTYLKSLGVNAIELMPVNEFDGNLSWGYNPNHYLALDKFYGTKNAFKQFIDVCHGEGIAVILDVVYNHSTEMSPYVRMYYNFELHQPADDSPFYNQIPKHDFNVFSDMNHEFEGSREYIKRAITYWLEEYRVDGYRLDLSKGLTQKNTLGNVAAWGQYDQSRINILEDYSQTAWAVNPNAYFILEHFADNSEEKVLSADGMMLWGNSNHNYNQATMGYASESNFQWISYKNRGWSEPHVMGYMESHDEQRLMYKNETYGNEDGSYSTKDTTNALRRMELAANFFFTVPGPKMFWQFGELGYDYDIEYNGRTGEKPIRWDYLEDWKRRSLMYVYTSLIELKKEEKVFETTDFDMDVSSLMKKIRLTSNEMSVVVLGNFDVVEDEIDPNFYSTGTWYDYWTGDSIVVTDVNARISLEAGEYRLYTDKKLNTPDFVGVDETIVSKLSDFVVYPNPATTRLSLSMHLKEASNLNIVIVDMQGRIVNNAYSGQQPGGLRNFEMDISGLQQGLYFVRVNADGQNMVKKVLVN